MKKNCYINSASSIKERLKSKLQIEEKYTPYILPTVIHLIGLFLLLIVNFLLITIYPNWICFILVFIINSILFYHFAVSVHEASHYTLIRPKKINNLLGSLSATIVFLDLDNYRDHHMMHHRKYGMVSDPDFQYYNLKIKKYKKNIILFCLLELFGFFAIKRFLNKTLAIKNDFNKRKHNLRVLFILFRLVAFHTSIFLLIFQFSYWPYYFIFWILPIITLSSLFNKIRLFCEHGGFVSTGNQGLDQIFLTRTHMSKNILFRIERIIFSPFSFNFHFEHHMFPQVPRQYLSEIHYEILNLKSFDKLRNNFSKSYLMTLNSLLRGSFNEISS